MSVQSAPSDVPEGKHAPGVVLRIVSMSRFLIAIGVVALLVVTTVLLVVAALAAYEIVIQTAFPGGQKIDSNQLVLASIKLIDLILLATVAYVAAVGLYELFIDSRLPVPAWLRVKSIDDLKQKLTSVVITVLGVVFLGQVISWRGGDEILPLGAAIAAVVAALSYFLSVQSNKAKPPKPPDSGLKG
jgi:uncharacterized membrane protein YqhA